MQIEHVAAQLRRKSAELGWPYTLGSPASESALIAAETRLGVTFPEQVKVFYRNYDGLVAGAPPVVVHSVANLRFITAEYLLFATIANEHDFCFDVSSLNQAEQWDIVAAATGYRVTLTMASFWSNKLWTVLVKNQPIWQEQF
jgi:cell wall assembly regulator SMI1